ncbi:MAG: SIMPL domain-containing protein [Streptosporangiaceae bacterium]
MAARGSRWGWRPPTLSVDRQSPETAQEELMSEAAGLLLSVRGEARREVAPDHAQVEVTVAASRGSKAEAARAAAEGLDGLTADLAALGGVALEAGTGRRPLTWSAQSITTYAERAHDQDTGQYLPTGQVTAAVAVVVAVRAFELLDALGAVLAGGEMVTVQGVTWHIDWDNPAWPLVRADAVQAAIGKGRDYAAALGGTLRSVEHIADAGLLGGDASEFAFTGSRVTARAASRGGGEPDAPSLDPVPQELAAIIEARFTADGVSLTAR